MPKLSYKLTEFHGGTNSNADPRDLADNEQPYTRDIDISKYGLIKIIPEAYPLAPKEREGTTQWNGGIANYGLYFFGADNTPLDNTDGNFMLTALYDGRYVDIYCAGTFADWSEADNWAADEIDFTGGTGSSQPLFYNADGVLRVYDRALANDPMWYGHIKPERFAGITAINSDGSGTDPLNDWVSTTAAPAAPTTGYGVMSTPQVGGENASTNPAYDDQNGGVNSAATEYIGLVSAEFCAINSVNLRVGVQMDDITFQTVSDIDSGTIGTPTNVSEIIPFIGVNSAGGNGAETCAKVYPGGTAQVTYSEGTSFDLKIDESNSLVFPIYIDTAVKSNITSMNFKVGDDSSNYYRWNFSGSDFKTNIWNVVVLSKDKNTATTGSPSDWGESFTYFRVEGNSSAADSDEPDWYQCGIATVPVSEELTGYPEGEHTFHYTWLYDDSKQESLPFEFANPDTALGDDKSKINILGDSVLLEFQAYVTIGALNTYGIDKRITGARLYDKVDNDDNYYLIGELDFIKNGFTYLTDSDTVDISIANAADSSAPLTYTGVVKAIRPVEANIIDTYKTINGYSTTTNSISAEYKAAVMQGRRTYIGNVKQDADGDGTAEFYEDRMLRSQVNKFDTFPSDSGVVDVAIRDGESIVKLESFNDRILQFKERTLYVINVSEAVEFLEDTFQFRGIGFPYHAVKTDIGVAFFNKFGCFLYDGRSVIDLLERQRRKTFDQVDFEDFIDGDDTDVDYSETHIAYLPEQKQLILTQMQDDVLIYDFTYQAWITRGVDRVHTINSKRSNLQLDWKSRMCYVTGNNGEIEYWQESGDTPYIGYKTKDIDFGEPGLKKKIYKVVVSYKGNGHHVSIYYGVDGEGFGSETSPTKTFDTTYPFPYSADWTNVVLTPNTLSQANNIYSFQIRLDSVTISATPTIVADTSTTQVQLATSESSVDDAYNGMVIRIISGAGMGQSRRITDYVGSSRIATITPAWTTRPVSGTYQIGWVQSDFAINDISIFYRLKPPGAGA